MASIIRHHFGAGDGLHAIGTRERSHSPSGGSAPDSGRNRGSASLPLLGSVVQIGAQTLDDRDTKLKGSFTVIDGPLRVDRAVAREAPRYTPRTPPDQTSLPGCATRGRSRSPTLPGHRRMARQASTWGGELARSRITHVTVGRSGDPGILYRAHARLPTPFQDLLIDFARIAPHHERFSEVARATAR